MKCMEGGSTDPYSSLLTGSVQREPAMSTAGEAGVGDPSKPEQPAP